MGWNVKLIKKRSSKNLRRKIYRKFHSHRKLQMASGRKGKTRTFISTIDNVETKDEILVSMGKEKSTDQNNL